MGRQLWRRWFALLLSFLWNLQSTSGATIYVNSNSNTSITECGFTLLTACPNIAAAFERASSYDIIGIQPGLYTGIGNENLDPQNISKVGLSLLGNGTSPDSITIQCVNENRFLHSENNFLTRIENLLIKNCTALVATIRNIGNGGALSFSDSSLNVLIKNVVFMGNRARSGGAILVTSGSLSIISCSFLYNQAGYWGGAISSVRSGITVIDSIFSGNSVDGELIVDPNLQLNTEEAGRGGAIHAYGGARMTISGTLFLSNSGQVAGGALFAKIVSGIDITNCDFQKNFILGTGLCFSENACDVRGGGIFLSDVALTLANSTFLGNEAITQDLSQFARGGAIAFSSDSFSTGRISSASNCTFMNNTAKGVKDNYAGGYGGAIFTDGVPIYIDTSTFLTNSAISEGEFTEYASAGGAIYISTVSAGSVTSCSFEDNYVDTGKGGAIYLTGSSIITLHNNTFIRNAAFSSFVFKAQGGALALGHSSFSIISSSTFEMNMALPKYTVFPSTYSGNGGAIFFQSSNGNITDSLFLGNVVVSGQFDSGAVGGAVATENSENVQILNTNFLFNSARGFFGTNAYSNSGAGGAIISQFSSMTVRNCLFRGNWVSAGGSQYSIGGAFAISYDYVPPTSSVPPFNSYPVIIDSCEFVDNVAGGEVCTTSSSAIYRAGQGGAIGVIGFESGNVEISNTLFQVNMALTDSQGIVTSFGGAIMYSLGSRLSCSRCTFINNIAWNGLGSDICSGYDDPESPFSTLSLSKSYFDGASILESRREHQRLVLLVKTLCFILVNELERPSKSQFYDLIDFALKISLREPTELPSDALRLSQSLFERFSKQYRFEFVRQSDWTSLPISFPVSSRLDAWDSNDIRRNLQLANKRVSPNILVMTGTGSVYEPILNSTYQICAGDLISLIIKASDDSISDSFFGVETKPQLSVIGSLSGQKLNLIGLSANITVVDQLNRQAVTLESLYLLNSTFFFSNNITISGSNIILGSILSSYVPAELANSTSETDLLQSLNINGDIKTGFSKSDSVGSTIEFLFKESNYLPFITLQHCQLRIFGKLIVASLVTNASLPSKFNLENGSSIIIEKTGNMSLLCPVFVETENCSRVSLANAGIVDLSPQLEPSYLNPLEVSGHFVQSTDGKLIFGISNSNYSFPSLKTKTNQTLLGNILMYAVDGTVYSPSSESKSPTSWSVFEFSETAQGSNGFSPSYTYPDGTDFKLSQVVHDIQGNAGARASITQSFVTSALSCSHRVEDYQISKSLAGDDDYMCWICLKNRSCGYCGLSNGGCIEPGSSCVSNSFKNSDHNCCPHMCRGRGKCVAQNDQNTAFRCECWIFYQGSSCKSLSVFTYLMIAAAIFIFLISLITLRYYYYYRQQKAKVLQELRVGLLAGGNDPGENRSYIQAIQQDLILRDVFVNYDEIVFEGKIGEGSFGEVFKASFRGAQVAVKQMRAPVFMQLSDKDIEEFRSEAYMMSRFPLVF